MSVSGFLKAQDPGVSGAFSVSRQFLGRGAFLEYFWSEKRTGVSGLSSVYCTDVITCVAESHNIFIPLVR